MSARADSEISSPVIVLLFDVGGVLVELGPPPLRDEWLTPGTTREAVWRDWISRPASRDFESGRTDADAFAAAMIGALGLRCDAATFLDAFAAWPIAPFPGTPEWLRGLRERRTVAVLSNTNELHLARMRDEMRLVACVDRVFASHEIGLVKPDAEIYRHAIDALGVPAGEIAFFDDDPGNVDAARALGMQVHHVVGPEAVRAAVASLDG